MTNFIILLLLILGQISEPIDSVRLSANHNILSRKTGGEIHFLLQTGIKHIGKDYIIMGGISGTSPGTILPDGTILPLNKDWVTRNMVDFAMNGQFLHNFIGQVPMNCTAFASLHIESLGCCTINALYIVACIYGPNWASSNVVIINIVD